MSGIWTGCSHNLSNASETVNQREWILGTEYIPAVAYLSDLVKIS
ncbi:MAG TPA: hypothetical protein P5201_15265 [Aminobacteriaceae bacterium]|nr:hypothetical protein [Aminobacteriaceae bacterium]